MRDYLRGRPTLLRVFLLIDARHGLKASDLAVMAVMDQAAVSYQVVLTKIDKIKPPELAEVVQPHRRRAQDSTRPPSGTARHLGAGPGARDGGAARPQIAAGSLAR